jgi:nucleoside-diphosphate-sugar epimerase
MRIFVTGASGFVGSAVVKELIGAGHAVVGLARSDASAAAIAAAGAEVHRGSLEDTDSLKAGAAAADSVIHTGFNHDFSRFAENCELDRRAILALGDALAGSDRPLLVTSGVGLLPPGRTVVEDDAVPATAPTPRIATEQAAAVLAERGVRVSVVRLPPSVHGEGDHGFVPIVIGMARKAGVSAYVGEGQNHWPAVHRLDAARLYRLAIEKGAADPRYHAVAEEGVAFREVATVIGRHLGLPVVALTAEEGAEHFGWFAHFAAIDSIASSARTRQKLGWEPVETGLLPDLDSGHYFAA